MSPDNKTLIYKFKAKVWKYEGHAAWHFITIPKKMTAAIRKNHGLYEEGWGRLKVSAQLQKSTWLTSIWYDSKFKSYLLPLKATVRKKENIEVGRNIEVVLKLKKEDKRYSAWMQNKQS